MWRVGPAAILIRCTRGIRLAFWLSILAALLFSQESLQRVDDLIYDLELRVFTRSVDSSIVIVAIDQPSLEQLGQWPWSRRSHAELVDRLTAAGARAIGFDIIFAEPQANDPEADDVLAQALRSSGKVVLPVLPEKFKDQPGVVLTKPFPRLAEAAARLGHVDVGLDEDGMTRSVYLEANLDSGHWQALSLALLSLGSGDDTRYLIGDRPVQPTTGFPYVWARDYRIFVPFAGPPGTVEQISYADILNDPRIAERVRGKFVVVGVTAAGLGSRFVTPGSMATEGMSGVEFNAHVMDVLLNGLAITVLSPLWGLVLTFLLVFGTIAAYDSIEPRWVLMAMASGAALTICISLLVLKVFHLRFEPSAALLGLLLSYPLWSWRRLEFVAARLYEEKERATATLHAIGDAVIATNARGVVEYLNPVAEALTGYSVFQARGRLLGEVFAPQTEVHTFARDPASPLIQRIARGYPVQIEQPLTLFNRNGQEFALKIVANPIRDPLGNLLGTVLACSDITETIRINRQITYLATHDSLTQLPNRHLLHDRLTQAISKAQRGDTQVAVLFIDLDGFKKVNDGLGHAVGDLFLRDTAQRLSASIRKVDTAARWGGDEFVVLLENLSHDQVVNEIAQKIVAALSRPFFFAEQEIFVTPSIGISLFPKDGDNAEVLLSRADSAMYRVKENGRNNFLFYAENLNDQAKERLQLERAMHYALEQGEFEVFYQPQVEPETGRIFSVEALLRWRHATRGLILPDHFIPLAEEVGLINPIGEWVIATVCKQLAAWHAEGLGPIDAAVNLSPRQFLHSDLPQIIVKALSEAKLASRFLKVEITESLMIKNVEHVAEILKTLKQIGVSISVDDFGTGYSSMSVLKHFPIDQLKIDKSFVQNVMTDSGDASITQAIIALAHGMSMSVIAEGIETEPQLQFFKEKGCDGIQGYYYSRPLPADQMTEMLRKGNVNRNR